MTNQTPESVIAEVRHRRAYSVYGDGTAYLDTGRLLQALELVMAERDAANMLREPGVPDAANRELTEAIRLTVEYVGNDMLPAIEGWDWYDALVKYAPEVAQAFVDKPIHFPKQTDAATEELARIKPLFENYSREYPNECNKRVKAEAERDAAVAAIERVRARLQPTLGGTPTGEFADVCGCGKDYFPCDHAAAIIAALDGAPEPEEKP